jgi:hypothetical protein
VTLTTSQITVGTSAVLLADPDQVAQRVVIHNNDSAQQIFVGNSGVTTSNGFHIDGKEEREFILNPGEALYGVASNSYVVSVMIQTQD